MNISGQVVKTSQLPKKTLGLGDSLLALINSPLETVTVPVSEFVTFVSNQIALGTYTLDTVTTAGNTTTNVINVGGVNSPYLQLNTVSPGSQAVGRFVWNDTDGTVDLRLKGNNVTLQLGQETVVRVVNKTGADLLESQYKVVRVRIASEGGAQGQRLAVVLAQGNNDPDSVTTLGIVTEDIGNNQEGFITVFGNVNGINTTGSLQGETWADGDVLFLSPTTPGSLTKVKPVAPNHTVVMGYVVYAHNNQGKIFVKVDNGYELEELHDVLPTPYVNNGVLYRDTTANLWRSATISTLLGGTPLLTVPTLSQVTTAGNTTTNAITVGGLVVDTNTLVVDSVNNRVGIGTASPAFPLDVQTTGTTVIRSYGTTVGRISLQNASKHYSISTQGTNLYFFDETAGVSRMFLNTTGDLGIGTTSPSNKLTIVSSSQNSGLSVFDFNGALGWGGAINLGVSGLSLETVGKIYTSLTNGGPGTVAGDLRFQTALSGVLSDKMVITAAGNIGIGTTTPSSLFTVNGTSVIREIISIENTSNNTPNYTSVWSFSNNKMSGFIGPSSLGSGGLAHHGYTATGDNSTNPLGFTGITGGTSPTVTSLLFRGGKSNGVTGVNPLASNEIVAQFRNWTTDLVTILGNGNVGIGTNNPVFKLDVSNPTGYSAIGVQSAASNNAEIHFKNAAYPLPRWTIRATAVADGASGNLTFQRLSNTFPMTITAGDNVLVGTLTDSARLVVKGSGTTSGTTTLLVQNANASASLVVLDNGNIGIGTTTPLTKLHILGTSDVSNGVLRIMSDSLTDAAFFTFGRVSTTDLIIGSAGTPSNLMIGTAQGDAIVRSSSGKLHLGVGYSNPSMTFMSGGNIGINTLTDAGYKLDVNGTTRMQGTTTITPAADTSAIVSTGYSVTGSGTTSLIDLSGTWNTTGVPTLIRANVTATATGGLSIVKLIDLQIGGSSCFSVNGFGGVTALSFSASTSTSLRNITFGGTASENTFSASSTIQPTAGTRNIYFSSIGFAPTSGTATLTNFIVAGSINQTGGANGITRGLYVNPTLTAAADWRSIEWSNNTGWGLYGVGTAPNYLGGSLVLGTTTVNASALLQVESTTKGFLPPRMTTAQILLISSPAEGLQVYNTDLKTICFYNGTAWQRVTSTAM